MKHTKLALAIIVLCGGMLTACDKQEAPAPEAMESAATTPDPMATDDGMPAEDGTEAGVEEDDTPHTGGDRVGTGTGGIEAAEEDDTPHTGGDRVGTGGGEQEGH